MTYRPIPCRRSAPVCAYVMIGSLRIATKSFAAFKLFRTGNLFILYVHQSPMPAGVDAVRSVVDSALGATKVPRPLVAG